MSIESNLIATISETIKKHNEEENKNLYQFEKNKLYSILGGLKDSLKKHKVVIAGGAITSLFTGAEINDLDLYFRNEQTAIDFLNEHWMDGETYVTCLTKKAVLLVKGKEPNFTKIQMIHFKYFENPEDIFDTFDFTVCMGAFDFETEKFHLHRDFMKHNSQRILKFNPDTAFPIVSLLRVHKYNAKKYTISKPELIRILLKCMTLDVNTVEKLKDHLGGMYGINYDKIISLDEGEQFSLELVIDKIANIALSEDYFKQPVEVKFDDIDDIIDAIKNEPIKMVAINDRHYRLKSDGTLRLLKQKAAFYTEVNVEDYFNNKKYYKWVKKVGEGNYRSHWDNNFFYKDGEVSIAQGFTSNSVIWLRDKNGFNHGSYSYEGVLIEVEVKPSDFISSDDGNVKAKACTVIREVPVEEYGKWDSDEEKLF